VLIVTVVLAGWYYGMGLGVRQVPVDLVVVLGLGSTVAVALHAVLQLWGSARVGLVVWPSMRWRHDLEVRVVTRRLVRSVGVAAWPAAGMYVLLALAGSVPGGVFVVQLSYSVFYSLSYVSARAVSMAVLPGLAQAAHCADGVTFGSRWRRGLSYAVIASLPLLVLLVVNSGSAADVLANGALRHAALIGPLATCLGVVAVAQLVGCMTLVVRRCSRGWRIVFRVGPVRWVLVWWWWSRWWVWCCRWMGLVWCGWWWGFWPVSLPRRGRCWFGCVG
jgi:putative peptidoglycan lipid II flippase